MIDDDCSAAMRIIRPTNCLDMAVMRSVMDSSMEQDEYCSILDCVS